NRDDAPFSQAMRHHRAMDFVWCILRGLRSISPLHLTTRYEVENCRSSRTMLHRMGFSKGLDTFLKELSCPSSLQSQACWARGFFAAFLFLRPPPRKRVDWNWITKPLDWLPLH